MIWGSSFSSSSLFCVEILLTSTYIKLESLVLLCRSKSCCCQFCVIPKILSAEKKKAAIRTNGEGGRAGSKTRKSLWTEIVPLIIFQPDKWEPHPSASNLAENATPKLVVTLCRQGTLGCQSCHDSFFSHWDQITRSSPYWQFQLVLVRANPRNENKKIWSLKPIGKEFKRNSTSLVKKLERASEHNVDGSSLTAII